MIMIQIIIMSNFMMNVIKIVPSRTDTGGIPAPAVTVCGINPDMEEGWKVT